MFFESTLEILGHVQNQDFPEQSEYPAKNPFFFPLVCHLVNRQLIRKVLRGPKRTQVVSQYEGRTHVSILSVYCFQSVAIHWPMISIVELFFVPA